jgi:hypothetical protein
MKLDSLTRLMPLGVTTAYIPSSDVESTCFIPYNMIIYCVEVYAISVSFDIENGFVVDYNMEHLENFPS